MEGLPRASDPLSADWITWVLIGCLLVLATINVGSPRKWRVLRQSVFRMRIGKQTLREEVDLRDRSVLGLLAVSAIVVSLFLWQAAKWQGIQHPPSYYILLIGIVLLLAAQGVLLGIVSLLTRSDGGTNEYLYSGTLLFTSLGIALFPIVALIAYKPEWRAGLLLAGTIIVGLQLLYRWLRGAWIGVGQGVPLGYIIIYLCASEIAPLLLAINGLWFTIHPTSPT
ncbi:MAG: DUF4271 domain-containing protein [Flavobacteriales bacterium]|nr:DUF4271 domain-containing protein [Flavobacteriales bacterium]MCC6938005.1 DUF4271 domain-containing protein [Flavobacteriales bacterium]